jgi:hypothetical protein
MKHDPKNLPLAVDLRMTENTAQVNIGEGILWRARVEPTSSNTTSPIRLQVRSRSEPSSTLKAVPLLHPSACGSNALGSWKSNSWSTATSRLKP